MLDQDRKQPPRRLGPVWPRKYSTEAVSLLGLEPGSLGLSQQRPLTELTGIYSLCFSTRNAGICPPGNSINHISTLMISVFVLEGCVQPWSGGPSIHPSIVCNRLSFAGSRVLEPIPHDIGQAADKLPVHHIIIVIWNIGTNKHSCSHSHHFNRDSASREI